MLFKRLMFWRRKRKRLVGQRTVAMKEAEIIQCFRTGPETPLWKGVNALIDELAQENMGDACDGKLPDSETKFALGGVDFAVRFKERAIEYFQRSSDEKEDDKDS